MTLAFEAQHPGQAPPRTLVITLSCDMTGCYRQDQRTTKSYIDARSDLRKWGWKESVDGKFSCPTCNGKTPDLFE